ncbi:type VI secretion system protein TssL, long form [Aurantivibrio plasticivorans]
MDNDDNTIIKPRPGKSRGLAPGGDADQTVIKPRPRPGGRVARSPASGLANDDSTVIKPRAGGSGRPRSGPLNLQIPNTPDGLKQSPLVDAATPILSVATQLRQLEGKIDIVAVHNYISQLIAQFERECNQITDDATLRKPSSYVLCALIDETVLNTHWGEHSMWSQKPMLSVFHKETYGGEKFYSILDECLSLPAKYIDLIEIIYLALSLGFMGKMRVDSQGAVKIEYIRSQLYEVLTRSRDRYKKTLSPQVNKAAQHTNRLHSFWPAWLFVASLILGAFGVYSYQLIQLNKQSDTTAQRLAGLIPIKEKARLPSNAQRDEFIALRNLLGPEIKRGILSVDDYTTHTAIVLHAAELFSSGSTDIKVPYEPVLDKIAKALESIEGRIVVSGHTDDQAIRSPRYPSNWHLSLARASAVVQYMDRIAQLEGRLLPEGRGENEPVASNETPEGRARNRRVVIDVYYPKGRSVEVSPELASTK